MAKKEEVLRHLVEVCGVSRREAEARLLDEDLWMLDPELRCAASLEGEEAVEQWEHAVRFADWLGDDNPVLGEAAQHLVWDMRVRAEEALRRARERVTGKG
jgi:hypothetical protein